MIQTYQNVVKLLIKKEKNNSESFKEEKINKISTKFTHFYQKFEERMEDIKAFDFKQATQITKETLENTNPIPTNNRSVKSKGQKDDITADNFIYSPSTGECNSFYDNLIESKGFKDRIRNETTILKDSTYHLTKSLRTKKLS